MAALNPGTIAPDFSLQGIDGKTYSLSSERQNKLVVAAFYKKSCPICQMTFPFLERIHQAYAGATLEVLGIAQNKPRETEEFAQEFELTFPLAVDDEPYAVSSAYGLTNVPSVFLIDHDGRIVRTFVGFDKQGLKDLSSDIAGRLGRAVFEVFTKSDNVPDFKPG